MTQALEWRALAPLTGLPHRGEGSKLSGDGEGRSTLCSSKSDVHLDPSKTPQAQRHQTPHKMSTARGALGAIAPVPTATDFLGE